MEDNGDLSVLGVFVGLLERLVDGERLGAFALDMDPGDANDVVAFNSAELLSPAGSRESL